jgi:hypothetical protein
MSFLSIRVENCLKNDFLGPKKLKFDIPFIVIAEEIQAALDDALYDFYFAKNF